MTATAPAFGHLDDLRRYRENVEKGRPLCDHCRGGGNELWAMFRACPECGGSGIDPAAQRADDECQADTADVALSVHVRPGIPCVAPTYPEWACTEDGDVVWVRLDLAHRAEEVAADALTYPDLELAEVGPVAMWLDREDVEWSGDWLLRTVLPGSDEAVVYVEFDVGERIVEDDDDE